jgi:hypothetical protein
MGTPLSFCRHPPIPGGEDFIVLANDEYKFKLLNANSKMIRRTILGPSLGSPVQKLHCILRPGTEGYLVFTTGQNIMGVTKLPLDGNPHRHSAVIAHPNQVGEL